MPRTANKKLLITREFDLPLELLFKAHADPDLLGQWLGTKVLKFEGNKHGSWQFATSVAQGKVLFQANGVFPEFVPNQKITRTFEMENTPFGVQLGVSGIWKKITNDTSKLNMHIVYRTVALRDQMLKMGMAHGINMAHNRLQDIAGKNERLKSMNAKVDQYLRENEQWREESQQLRKILLDCGLTEDLKWNKPCYAFQGTNVIVIQGFKACCALLFFKGVLMKDPHGILGQDRGENTRVGRQIRFPRMFAK